jgi:hypothetical protein
MRRALRPLRRRLRPLRRRLKSLYPPLRPWLMPMIWTTGFLKQAHPAVKIPTVAATAVFLFTTADLAYQVTQKPTEMLSPLGSVFNRLPYQTWRAYGDLFQKYSTAAIAPELLAALAQTESMGNPLAHTYWRWHFTWRFFDVFAPASSAVGLYQMTDAAFIDAQAYCIQQHKVVPAANCWFARYYVRVLPQHAIQLTAINLDRYVTAILAGLPRARPTAQQKQDLAAILHLCGAGIANGYARRGFKMPPGMRCGEHDAAAYVAKVDDLMRVFRKLAAST